MKQVNPRSVLTVLIVSVPLAVAVVAIGAGKKDSGQFKLIIPLGLEQDYLQWIPADNPLSAANIELGKKLYFDPRLSADGTVSCATCHNPKYGFADNEPTSTGVGRQRGNRNSPTVLNRLYSKAQFWDGRAASLEEQALGPVQNPVEMANTLPAMVANLSKLASYKPLFQKAFGSPEITADRVAKAIATFERTLLSGDSAFDKFQAGDASAISEAAKRGFALFMGKANCNACHSLPNFTDEAYHNVGVGMDRPNLDLGRYMVTKDEKDKGAFKTPTLRQIAETTPYLHDGSEKTLEAVVEFYDRGGLPNPNLDAKMKPLGLTDQEKKDLVEFLKSLTGAPLKAELPVVPE